MEQVNKERLENDLLETKRLMLRNSPQNVFMTMISGDCNFLTSKHNMLYTFATEDMRTYFKEFKCVDSFLTICASGDQVVNASLAGAKVIDTFDVNPLCRRGLALKIGAIKGLSKEEFLEFFQTFNPLLFAKFADKMSEEDIAYWVMLYKLFDLSQAGKLIKDFLYSYAKMDISTIVRINPYLRGSGFNKVREMLDKTQINYIDSDLYRLPNYVKGKKYDGMNFSNVYEYINYGDNTSAKVAREYYNFLINEMYPLLNNGGAMLAAYTYAFNDKVNEGFKEMYNGHEDKLTYPGALNMDQYTYYLMGLTTQNLAYSTLYDLLGSNGEDVSKVQTEHIRYGQSMDMSHDTAVFIKKYR